jgi:hypothetical protein
MLGETDDELAKLRSGLELHDSRVNQIDLLDSVATVYFSHAYIHKSTGTPGRDRGTGWSQEARLVLSEAEIGWPLPTLPNTISEGYLEVGGIRHEVIPLPFKRKVGAKLCLIFADGTRAELVGTRPFLELQGRPIYLEDYS